MGTSQLFFFFLVFCFVLVLIIVLGFLFSFDLVRVCFCPFSATEFHFLPGMAALQFVSFVSGCDRKSIENTCMEITINFSLRKICETCRTSSNVSAGRLGNAALMANDEARNGATFAELRVLASCRSLPSSSQHATLSPSTSGSRTSPVQATTSLPAQ